MEFFLFLAVALLIPTAAVAWFVVALVLFAGTPAADTKRRPRMVRVIVSGILAALMVSLTVFALIAFAAMFLSPIGHM